MRTSWENRILAWALGSASALGVLAVAACGPVSHPTCASDEECGEGLCVDGACQECATDVDCGGGQLCVSGSCVGSIADGGACVPDECGTCDHDPDNDCEMDCAGQWGGPATEDGCGVCDADASNDCVRDCAGEFGGEAFLDRCGTCDADPGNDCVMDCAGVWGGGAALDGCGTCDADPSNDCPNDCAGVPGGPARLDMCGTCDADASNDCVADCNDEWGGAAVMDACDRCAGGSTGLDVCAAVTLAPTADAHVDETASGSNFGGEPRLVLERETGGLTQRLFLRFDLSSIPAGAIIRDVVLTAHAEHGHAHGGDGNVYTYLVGDDAWDEGSVTWANQPGVTGSSLGHWWLWYRGSNPPSAQTGVNSSDALRPVTQIASDSDRTISFRLHSTGYDTTYYSREYVDADFRPSLRVVYALPTRMTLGAVADATVSEHQPDGNLGASKTLLIESENRSDTERIFLRFDLSTLPADAYIGRVSLSMHAHEGAAHGGDGYVYNHLVPSDDWDELAISWANQPGIDASRWLGRWWLWFNASSAPQTGRMSGETLRAALQTELEGDSRISFRLHSPGYATNYRSREHATADERPLLTVDFVR